MDISLSIRPLSLAQTLYFGEELPEKLSDHVTYVQVESTEDAVGKVATLFYGNPSHKLKLVGVTGTNGKTTIATLYIICSASLATK